ncbi:hypothetical protein CRE_13806 [Caenorhabditis remanei]|uniref:Uncharacterized protein n=1 Tax=Caenorhabditis remanei TaxID=31234 RepID=E3NM65_CAERE|nr:hypothetical protein CRE_13806 [Caenorhabditis remanei]
MKPIRKMSPKLNRRMRPKLSRMMNPKLNLSHSYHIDSFSIPDSPVVRDLGLLTDPKLKFHAHITRTVNLSLLSLLSHSLEKPLRLYSRKVLQRCNISFSSYPHRLEILNLVSLRHRRLKSQLLLLYNLISGATYFPHLNYHVKISQSPRRPMTLFCCHPSIPDFFASTIPIWNAITTNVPQFLPPSKFETLLNSSITRF